MDLRKRFVTAGRKTGKSALGTLPVLLGVLLLTGLLTTLAADHLQAISGTIQGAAGPFIGAAMGSIAAGHPMTSYVIGGELLAQGISSTAIAALIVSWVTVGLVQLPAEATALGVRFALWRAVLCFISAVAIAYLTVGSIEYFS